MEENKDPFLKAIRKIAEDKDSKFFLEWLVAGKLQALKDLAEANTQEEILKKSGGFLAWSDIIQAISAGLVMEDIKEPLTLALEQKVFVKATLKREYKNSGVVKKLLKKIF